MSISPDFSALAADTASLKYLNWTFFTAGASLQ